MTSKPFPAFAVLTLLAGLTVLITACAKVPDASAARKPDSSGSAEPAVTARPQPTAMPTAPNTTPVACPYDGTPITIRPGDQPAPICLHPGDLLTLGAQPSPTQPWQPPTSSAPATLRCDSRPLADGALTATCHALGLGTASVSTTTAAFAGDPHGPAQYTWTLTVHVTPAP